MRMAAQEENPLALLDRGVAGIRGRTLIVNLPTGPATVAAFLEPVLDLLAPIVAHLHEADECAHAGELVHGCGSRGRRRVDGRHASVRPQCG
ncbi:MAG: hypothetical protein R2838_03175 [Caldilineaceae bacterium]